MSPSHANKNRKRYRYYVTRPDQLNGARAWRVSAHDLEQLICSHVAELLLDRQFMLGLASEGAFDAEQLQTAAAEADMSAATLRSGSAHARVDLLAPLVAQVRLFEDRIEVELDDEAARTQLRINAEMNPITEPTIISIPAVRVRRGHQLRLVVPGPESMRPNTFKCDEKLVRLIAEAHQARQLVLAHPDRSLASIARDNGRCRTRLGKLVAIACLAPDIVTAIIEGKQAEHLTVARLLSKSVPLSWSDQRRELGLSH
jgi:hypothetical protein